MRSSCAFTASLSVPAKCLEFGLNLRRGSSGKFSHRLSGFHIPEAELEFPINAGLDLLTWPSL